jgi:hypothetical protein
MPRFPMRISMASRRIASPLAVLSILTACSPAAGPQSPSAADVPGALLDCPPPSPPLSAGATVRDALLALERTRADHHICHGRLGAIRRLIDRARD